MRPNGLRACRTTHKRPGAYLAAASLATALTACTSAPQPTVRQAYIAQHAPFVDSTRPCALHPFNPVEIKIIHHTVYLPVSVNGVFTIGIMDTGADSTIITPELAAAANVQTFKITENIRGVSGSFSTTPAAIKHLQIGSIVFDGARNVQVYPFAGSNGLKVGALIGGDSWEGLDYDVDFTHQTMRPFETENCLEIDPPWRNTATGVVITRGSALNQHEPELGYYSLSPFHLTIPVAFPGDVLNGLFDTGSPDSLLSYTGAKDAGLSAHDIRADPVSPLYGLNGRPKDFHTHRFSDIAIGEDEMRDVPMHVAMGFDRRDPPMILGMDYIEKHHFWISYTTNALFIDSGEPRKRTPPLGQAHSVGGAGMPGFPPSMAMAHKTGKVVASCWVETDGALSGCHIVTQTGGNAFGDATLFWLTNAAHPVMQPAYVNGKPIRQEHSITIDFAP